MHVPLLTSIAHHLLPLFSPSSGNPVESDASVITFEPIHAVAHTLHPASDSPVLLLHNASATHSLYSIPDISSFSALEAEEHLLDYPAPHLAALPLSIRTKQIAIRRPRHPPPTILSWAYAARRSRGHPGLDTLPVPLANGGNTTEQTWVAPDYNDDHGQWEDVEVRAPDVTDRQTLITLAKMTSNAYVTPDSGEWWPTAGWNQSLEFGWEPDADGLRGHVVGGLLVTRTWPNDSLPIRRMRQ
jgi:lipase ATG15